MDSVASGKISAVSAEHPLNAAEPIVFSLVPKVTFASDLQPLKAFEPIVVTSVGSTTCVSGQPWNIALVIFGPYSSNVTLASEAHDA